MYVFAGPRPRASQPAAAPRLTLASSGVLVPRAESAHGQRLPCPAPRLCHQHGWLFLSIVDVTKWQEFKSPVIIGGLELESSYQLKASGAQLGLRSFGQLIVAK